MAAGGGSWIRTVLRTLDGTLRSASDGLRRTVRTLRILRVVLVVAVVVVLGSAVVGIVEPDWLAYAYAAAAVFLVIPLVLMLLLVALPLRAKSVIRLIDLGYPRSTRDAAVRFAARRLHERSFESEELLIETAWNESKKMLRAYRERAERMRHEWSPPRDDGHGGNGHHDHPGGHAHGAGAGGDGHRDPVARDVGQGPQ